MATETTAEKLARMRKLTSAQRAAILKNFKLTAAQQASLRNMSPDRQDSQLKTWQDQYVLNNLSKVSSVTKNKTPAQTNVPEQAAVSMDWETAAKELYGGYYSIVQSVPELQALLRQAVQEGWSDGKFEYALRQTSWWKQNSDSARQWDLGSQMDPATAEQQVQTRVAEFRNLAMDEFQIDLGLSDLTKIARDSLRGGWTEQMVKNAIGILVTKTEGGMSQLASGYVGQTVRETANQYGLKLSQDVANQWVSAIATGQATQKTFQQYALSAAKSLFPAISSQLDGGMTFQQIVDPYKNVASRILEINPDTIDFVDPKWAAAISNVDQNGQQRPMSFTEWGNYLRNNRSFGYEYTSDAQTKAYEVANQLANLFGQA